MANFILTECYKTDFLMKRINILYKHEISYNFVCTCKHFHDILAETETFNVLLKQSFMLVGVGI